MIVVLVDEVVVSVVEVVVSVVEVAVSVVEVVVSVVEVVVSVVEVVLVVVIEVVDEPAGPVNEQTMSPRQEEKRNLQHTMSMTFDKGSTKIAGYWKREEASFYFLRRLFPTFRQCMRNI